MKKSDIKEINIHIQERADLNFAFQGVMRIKNNEDEEFIIQQPFHYTDEKTGEEKEGKINFVHRNDSINVLMQAVSSLVGLLTNETNENENP